MGPFGHESNLSEEGGLDGFFFSAKLDEGQTLCLAPLSDQAIAASGDDVPDPSGHWLYEKDQDGRVELIAQVATNEAAWRLRTLLKLR